MSRCYKGFSDKEQKEDKMKRWGWIFIFLIPWTLWGQDSVKVIAYFDSPELYIGQKLFLAVEVSLPKTGKVFFPQENPPIKGLESLKSAEPSRVFEEGTSAIYTKRYAYIAFDSLISSEDSINVSYTLGSKQNVPVLIQIKPFQIKRIFVDTTDALRAAYGPFPPKKNADWKLFIWLAVLAAILAAVFGFIQWRKNKKRLAIPELANPREWALQQLELLEKEVPFKNEKYSWSTISDVLRLYLEKAWNIPAPYFSTGEILFALSGKAAYSSQISNLEEVLKKSDQVKFAKEKSTEKEQREALRLAETIVNFNQEPQNKPEKEEVKNG